MKCSVSGCVLWQSQLLENVVTSWPTLHDAHDIFSQTATCKQGNYKQQCRITELCEASSPNADLVHSTVVMSEAVWLCMPVFVHAFIIVVLLALMALLQNVLCAGAQFVYVPVCSYGMSLHHRLPDGHTAQLNCPCKRKDGKERCLFLEAPVF